MNTPTRDKTDALVARLCAEAGRCQNLSDAALANRKTITAERDERIAGLLREAAEALATGAGAAEQGEKLRSLSERIRPGIEAAPWVCEEMKRLLDSAGNAQGEAKYKDRLLAALERAAAAESELHEIKNTPQPAVDAGDGAVGASELMPCPWCTDARVHVYFDEIRAVAYAKCMDQFPKDAACGRTVTVSISVSHNTPEKAKAEAARRWNEQAIASRPAAAAVASDEAVRLFNAGWYAAADLGNRDDLYADIGSPFYEKRLADTLDRRKWTQEQLKAATAALTQPRNEQGGGS